LCSADAGVSNCWDSNKEDDCGGKQEGKTKHMKCIGEVKAWLAAALNIRKGTLLPVDGWCNNAYTHYRICSHKLQEHCDGCGKDFLVEHGINSKEGDLPFFPTNIWQAWTTPL
jgi:hypothetical protein